MSKHIQSIRGMHDILPGQTPLWQLFESVMRDLVSAYGYQEIRMPVVEMTELFCRSIGEVTDIVEKEMYTFDDRNGDSLALRPEGTASCVRAGLQHGLLHNQQQRLWYMGPMFRHERPQKGRYRQFHQVGVETYGIEGPDIDAELIALTARLWKQLNLKNIRLEINSLGSNEARNAYREQLIVYLSKHKDALDEDSLRRLDTNPLRVLDSKNPDVQAVVKDAPELIDHLDAESQAHFDGLKQRLDALDIEYVVNPRLVRGLDYYSRTVFEWVTDELGAQGTVCAGGRYDGLVEQLGGRETSACGFAMGIERLLALMESQGVIPTPKPVDAYAVLMGEEAQIKGMLLIEQLRNELPKLSVMLNVGSTGAKAQFKRADKSGARWAFVIGAEEINNNCMTIKFLRDANEDQLTLSLDEATTWLNKQLGD